MKVRLLFHCLIVSLLLLFNVHATFAQEQDVEGAAVSPTPTPIKYDLPYPGLLPDSPLYFLKTARDRLINFLIADPLKKAEFNLLQADKRLGAGVYLFKKEKVELAETTLSKGENYLEQAIEKAKEAQKQGRETSTLEDKLFLATKKHQEVLRELEEKTTGDIKKRFKNLSSRVQNFEKQVDLLR